MGERLGATGGGLTYIDLCDIIEVDNLNERQVMAKQLTALVKIYDDKIETIGDSGGMFHRYWIREAGIHPDHLYPCVMVELLLEIKHLQELGYEVLIFDERSENDC